MDKGVGKLFFQQPNTIMRSGVIVMKAVMLVLLVITIGLSACGGGGGGSTTVPAIVASSASTSSSSIVSSSSSVSSATSVASSAPKAILVEKTSYLNKVKFGDPNHGKAYIMANAKGNATRPLAYGDFLQDGSTTVLSVDYLENYSKFAADWIAPRIYFFKKVGASWVDVTNKLLKDTTGCKGLKKASVADFNNDGRPDLFLGCTGADTTDSIGENVRILLSQADGTYVNNELPLICYCHGSAAGDINGDGNIDVVTYDNLSISSHYPHPIALIGNGDGTFKQDLTRFNKRMEWTPIFTLDLIDTGRGMLDLLVGGNGATATTPECNNCTFENSIVRNDGAGNFRDIYPIDNTQNTTGEFFALGLDFIVKDGYLYMSQIGDLYKAIAVRKVDLQDLKQSTLIYQYVSPNQSGPDTWFPWLALLDNGTIASMCDYSDVTSAWCNWTGI